MLYNHTSGKTRHWLAVMAALLMVLCFSLAGMRLASAHDWYWDMTPEHVYWMPICVPDQAFMGNPARYRHAQGLKRWMIGEWTLYYMARCVGA